MVWIIAYRLIDGEYERVLNGSNIVINQQVDKVLPVEEHVARQAHKLIYDGEKLRVKEGQILLSLEELNAEQNAHDEAIGIGEGEGDEIVNVDRKSVV